MATVAREGSSPLSVVKECGPGQSEWLVPWACLIDDYVTRYHASYTPELRDEHNLINTTMLGKLGVYSA